MILDLGKRNKMCRFFFTKYAWCPMDIERYDRDGDLPRSIGRHKRIPVLPLSFVSMDWVTGAVPQKNKHTHFAMKMIAKRPPSLFICDMTPEICIRHPHPRFIVPHCAFPSGVTRHRSGRLEGSWDQYRVEGLELLHVLEDALDDSIYTVADRDSSTLPSGVYGRWLQDALSQGVVDWGRSVEDDLKD